MALEAEPYSDIRENNHESCDYVGDFFTSPLVKRTLGDVWNEVHMPEDAIENPRDFDIHNPRHLSFIRQVWEVEEFGKIFLKALRARSIQVRNIGRLKYDSKQMVWFILLWKDIQLKLNVTPESLTSIFSQKAANIILDTGEEVAFSHWENITTRLKWFNFLTSAGFSIIDEEGDLVYGLEDGSEFYDFFKVVNQKGQIYFIDKNGKVVANETYYEHMFHWLQKAISFHDECISFLQWKSIEKYTKLRIQEQVASFAIPSSWDKDKDIVTVIEVLKSEKEKLAKELREVTIHSGKSHLQIVSRDWVVSSAES